MKKSFPMFVVIFIAVVSSFIFVTSDTWNSTQEVKSEKVYLKEDSELVSGWEKYTHDELGIEISHPSSVVPVEVTKQSLIFVEKGTEDQKPFYPIELIIYERKGNTLEEALYSEVSVKDGGKPKVRVEEILINNGFGLKTLEGFAGENYLLNDINEKGPIIRVNFGKLNEDSNYDLSTYYNIFKTIKFIRETN